jgi:hypothetical protein
MVKLFARGALAAEFGGGVVRYLDRIGVGGSLFAALCCLGFPALVSLLSAIGLGFLMNDAILIPLLILFLARTIWVSTLAFAIITDGVL